jgi:hypothetical protein
MHGQEMAGRVTAGEPADGGTPTLMEVAAHTPEEADLVFPSGRRIAIEPGRHADRLTVRSRGGEIVLRVDLTDAGPIFSFTGADVEVTAAKRLRLRAAELDIHAAGDIALTAGGSLREQVGADHHARVAGAERIEAARVEVQASEESVSIRAMQRIALDGEHIGLNDDPAPAPFPWSTLGEEGGGRPW